MLLTGVDLQHDQRLRQACAQLVEVSALAVAGADRLPRYPAQELGLIVENRHGLAIGRAHLGHRSAGLLPPRKGEHGIAALHERERARIHVFGVPRATAEQVRCHRERASIELDSMGCRGGYLSAERRVLGVGGGDVDELH